MPDIADRQHALAPSDHNASSSIFAFASSIDQISAGGWHFSMPMTKRLLEELLWTSPWSATKCDGRLRCTLWSPRWRAGPCRARHVWV